jgi:hypothetical protein
VAQQAADGYQPVVPPQPRPQAVVDSSGEGEGRNPLPLIGTAAGAGILTAKVIDWRGHAHPRR